MSRIFLNQATLTRIFLDFVDLLDEVLNIFNMLGTSTPLEKNINIKASYLRKACKEMSTLGFLK